MREKDLRKSGMLYIGGERKDAICVCRQVNSVKYQRETRLLLYVRHLDLCTANEHASTVASVSYKHIPILLQSLCPRPELFVPTLQGLRAIAFV